VFPLDGVNGGRHNLLVRIGGRRKTFSQGERQQEVARIVRRRM
jgi:hypothetical protein